MSDTGDTSIVAGTETPAQGPAGAETAAQAPAGTEMPAQAPQPVAAPQTGSSPRGNGWFRGGVRSGIIAAVVVVVAGAFFTIGWFTSTRGDHERPGMMNGIFQKMGMRERGGLPGVPGRGGAYQWQGRPGGGRGMIVPQQGQGQGMIIPQQGQGQGQIVPIPQSPSSPQGQSIQQGYLGVGLETVTPALQQQYGLSRSSGVLVASIDGSGPALKAGIQRGDIITSINGAAVAQQQEVVGLIANMKAGDSVSVSIDRNGQNLSFQVTLAGRPTSGSISG